MNRINGYLDLDKEFFLLKKENHQNIVETKRCSSMTYWIKNLHGKNYLFKIITEEDQKYRSLLIEKMASFVGIPFAHTELARWGYFEGELIEDYRKDGYEYISGTQILYEYYETFKYSKSMAEILPSYLIRDNLTEEEISEVIRLLNNLDNIWDALEFRFRKRKNKNELVQKIMSNLTFQFAMDFITMQRDRHSSNWEIEENSLEANLTPMYDSNRSFYNISFRPLMNVSYGNNNHFIYEELKNFMSVSSIEFQDYMTHLFLVFTPDKIEQFLKEIEVDLNKQIPLKSRTEILESYQRHYEKMKPIILERGINFDGKRIH